MGQQFSVPGIEKTGEILRDSRFVDGEKGSGDRGREREGMVLGEGDSGGRNGSLITTGEDGRGIFSGENSDEGDCDEKENEDFFRYVEVRKGFCKEESEECSDEREIEDDERCKEKPVRAE